MYRGYAHDSSSSNPTCTFCKQNHSSAKFNIITDPALRKAILRSKAKCLICLRSGQKAVNVNLTPDASNVIQNIIYLFVTLMVYGTAVMGLLKA